MDSKEYKVLAPIMEQMSAFSLKGFLKHQSTSYLHYHKFHQILKITNGVSLLEDQGKKRPFYGKNAAFIPAGVPHRSVVLSNKVTYQSLYFHKKYFPCKSSEIIVYSTTQLSRALLNRLSETNLGDLCNGTPGKCLELFFHLFSHEIKMAADTFFLPSPQARENEILIQYIRKNYHKKITLNELSGLTTYSPRHVVRLFKKELKISPLKYAKLFRLLMASLMLTEPHTEILDIIFNCGYDSVSSFYLDFKKLFGTSPGHFRKIMNTGN